MRQISAILTIALTGLTLFSGCSSIQITGSSEPFIQDVADIHFELTLLGRDELRERFGKDENPFIDYPGKLPRKHILVFQASISSEETVLSIDRNETYVTIANGNHKGMSARRLINVWEPYYRDDRDEAHKKRTMNTNLKSDTIEVSPDSPFQGLLVFMIPVDENTKGIAVLPAVTSSGDRGDVEIPFSYRFVDGGIKGYSETEKEDSSVEKNTGIFADDQ